MPKQTIIGGKPQNAYIRVRVQEMVDGKTVSTRSFSVYGEKMRSVTKTIEAALEEQYGAGDEVDDDDEQEDVSVAAPIKLKRKAG